MSKSIRILKHIFVSAFIVVFTCTGCASAKKNKFSYKKTESTCDLSHLGRNKYFYSSYYQRKLAKSVKEIARHK